MRKLLILLPAMLAACSTTAQAPLPPKASEGTGMCSNTGLEAFVGQARSEELGARLLAQSGARAIRWVEDGTMVTMEFSPERLTVMLDAQNRILSARCG